MSSFFNCAAYDDVATTIRLDDHVVFLALEDKEKNTSIHLTTHMIFFLRKLFADKTVLANEAENQRFDAQTS